MTTSHTVTASVIEKRPLVEGNGNAHALFISTLAPTTWLVPRALQRESVYTHAYMHGARVRVYSINVIHRITDTSASRLPPFRSTALFM